MISESTKQILHDKGYKYLKTLGSGGFGRVYLVREYLSNNFFAIKHLKNSTKSEQINILREIKALGKLNHPNIISYKTSFREEDSLYLVMEQCYHGSLNNYLQNKEHSLDLVMGIFIKLTEVFQYLHSKGMVHHDIKPANILVSEDETLKISDFGTVNTTIGTIIYSAPEMLEGNPTTGDLRVDIYSLGVSMLEILNNAHPFKGLSKEDLILKVRNANLPIEYFELWLQQVILKACHFDPEARFQSMKEFHDALINRQIPVLLSESLINDERIVQKLKFHLQLRQWKRVRKILFANYVADNNLSFTILKGKYYLSTHDLSSAKMAFEKAIQINRHASVEKELAEIYLSENQTAKATSLLLGYLNRNFFDPEAINLLLHAYFLSGRWEFGLDQAKLAVIMFPNDKVFKSNLFLFQLLNQCAINEEIESISSLPFVNYNQSIISEETFLSWNYDKTPFLSSKVLFHEYRFNSLTRSSNVIVLGIGKKEYEENKPIISFGRNGYIMNDYALFDDSEVSRRHFVIINQSNNVWLYDLGSYSGVFVDGVKIHRKIFLLGIHTIAFGKQQITVKTDKNILL